VEDGFFAYAIRDAIATRPAYLALLNRAERLLTEFPGEDILPDARERFGLLTEALQVKKAIALAPIGRAGMHVDQRLVEQVETDLRRRLDAAMARAREVCPGLYKTDEAGRPVLTNSGAPSRSNRALDEQLQKVVEEIVRDSGISPSVPLTKKTRKRSLAASV